jgi:hypothetical protein
MAKITITNPKKKPNILKNMSSMFPDGNYRPIPIVWFTRSLLTHIFMLLAAFFSLYSFDAIYTVIASVLATVYVSIAGWHRGLKSASYGWKIATFLALIFNLALVSIASMDRIPFAG